MKMEAGAGRPRKTRVGIHLSTVPRGRITSCDQWALDAREPSETSARNRTRTAIRRLRNQRDRGRKAG
jgi:hypothetical protein